MGPSGVRLLYTIVPESAEYLVERDLAFITRTTVFATSPDDLCVSGPTAGAATDMEALRTVKANAGDTPVFVNTGMRAETAEQALSVADGAVVGTFFPRNGVFENEVDAARVRELMSVVAGVRRSATVSAGPSCGGAARGCVRRGECLRGSTGVLGHGWPPVLRICSGRGPRRSKASSGAPTVQPSCRRRTNSSMTGTVKETSPRSGA